MSIWTKIATIVKKNTNLQTSIDEDEYPIRRGQLYYAKLDDERCVGSEQMKDRLVLIVQNNTGNKYSKTVVVAMATTKIDKRPDLPVHKLVCVNKFGKQNMILAEQLRTIDKQRLVKYVGRLSSTDMAEVDEALACSLDLARREAYEGA